MLYNRGVITYYFPVGRQNVSLGFCRSGMYTSYFTCNIWSIQTEVEG